MPLMNKPVSLVITVSLMVPVALGAQDCPHGPSRVAPNELELPYGWPEQPARAALVKALRKAGFNLQGAIPTDTIIVTQPHVGWGKAPDRRHWLEHPHPGVVLVARVLPEADSSRVTLQVQAVCAVPRTESPHDHGTPEEVAQLLASMDAGTALVEEYKAWRRSHPRAKSQHTATAAQPPQLLSCRRSAHADSTFPHEVGGQVIVQGVVDTTGRFERGRVRVVSSDHPDLDAFALEIAATCRFRPGMHEGRPIRVLVRIPIRVGR